MINPIITNNVINNASTDALKTLAKELIKHIDLSYDYNDMCKNEILNILITGKIKTKNDIDVDFIIKNIDGLLYSIEGVIRDDIEVVDVNNIKCTVLVKFNKKYSNDEIRDITEEISWINHPEIIKKS
jgi:hypothetical protein